MERIWLEHYPEGVPADITDQAAAFDSLVDLFEQSCGQYAGNTAYVSMGASLTYAQTLDKARAFAGWLQAQGVSKGDRVALMMPNLLQYPICLFGTLMAGAAVVNTNPLYTPHELHHQLTDSGTTTVVVAENFAHTLQEAMLGTQVKRVVVTSLGELLGFPKGLITDLVVRHVKKMVPAWNIPGALRLREVLAEGARASYRRPALTHADLAALQYTGGTTGVAKGAMLSHGNLVANVCQAYAWVRPYCQGDRECIVTALPLYHIFALTANCLTFMRLGASNLLIVNPRDIPGFVKELGKARFTALTGVNTLFNALLNHPDFARLDFSSLNITLGGGMAVQEAIAERWLKTTGKPIAQAYGLTETSPAVTINPLDKVDFNGSIGLPVPSTDVAIRNDNRTMAIGESGEICVKGPQVTAGYWNRPEETAKVFDADGWLLTGDIGYMNDKGYVFLLDRKKDMILVSGFNVYPNEVEAAAIEHPGILEAAAIGVPGGASGEAVKLYVIRKDPNLTEADVIAHCRKLLTGYKVPKFVEFREDLPRSNVGKILRKELRNEKAQQTA
ncbi:Long-chain-fatty-acid--CoA ligase [Castellaniella defragrans 65Phen]|uniref:Long-chain-fatty-acid--CoA ligase n=1 Tax=Castellaniella defragrans (strain DSM 12143 / CCUG 39792 / 65Phen) TaxID=1437824 RepID=W8X877_CASD6|nr:AMP-binding protein [Castellaniella defragrans]CDM22595.1 Long-chain-fatty-acid--CoA ligase [Castellaniella defragrans 65Phen]